jgi:hypothetical protein
MIVPVVDEKLKEKHITPLYTIREIPSLTTKTEVNVIGCICKVGKLESVYVRDIYLKKKRKVELIDESGQNIVVSIWGQNACRETFEVG